MTQKEKTFLLGLGTQKAGTTWLHDLLSQQRYSNFGCMKEYHVFDARTLSHCSHFQVSPARQTMAKLACLGGWDAGCKIMRRAEFQRDTEKYFDYFAECLHKHALTGDITPSYCGLSVDTLSEIVEGFRSRGIRVKAVFLMRDPVSRCLSAVKMNLRKKNINESVDVGADVSEALENYFKTVDAVSRTNYHATVSSIRQVFSSEDMFLGMMEDLFTTTAVVELGNLLALPIKGADFSRKINASKGEVPVDPRLENDIAHFYRPAIDAAITEFGEERVMRNWRSARLLRAA